MNRRGFLRSLIGAAAVVPAVRTWPFRTFFFPPAPRIVGFDDPWTKPIPLSWIVNGDQEEAWNKLVALELENVREEIPRLFLQSETLYRRLRRKEPLPRGIKYLRIPKLGGDVEWKNLERSSSR